MVSEHKALCLPQPVLVSLTPLLSIPALPTVPFYPPSYHFLWICAFACTNLLQRGSLLQPHWTPALCKAPSPFHAILTSAFTLPSIWVVLSSSCDTPILVRVHGSVKLGVNSLRGRGQTTGNRLQVHHFSSPPIGFSAPEYCQLQPSVLQHAQKCNTTAAIWESDAEELPYLQSLKKIIIKVYTVTITDSILYYWEAAVSDLMFALLPYPLRTQPH